VDSPERVEVLEHAQEGLLDDVFGVLALAEDAPGQAVNALLEAAHQGLEGSEISLAGTAHEVQFQGRRTSHPALGSPHH
jgi:hypothetical protein